MTKSNDKIDFEALRYDAKASKESMSWALKAYEAHIQRVDTSTTEEEKIRWYKAYYNEAIPQLRRSLDYLTQIRMVILDAEKAVKD